MASRFGITAALVALALLAPREAAATDLVDLYARAMEYDPQYLGARYANPIADQALREARSAMLPQLFGGIEETYTIQDVKHADVGTLYRRGWTRFTGQGLTLNLTQSIYRMDYFARIEGAKVQIRQAAYQFADAEQDLVLRFAQASFSYLAEQENLAFSTTERTQIQRQVQESEEKLASGMGSITEVYDARGRYALAQAAEVAAKDAVEEGKQALAEIIGSVPEDFTGLSDNFPLTAPDRMDVEEWVKTSMFQNPKLKALEAGAEIAAEEVKVQKGALVPSIEFNASYDDRNSGGSQYLTGGATDINTTLLMLRARIPLYDGGRASAATRTAALQREVVLQKLEQERRRVEREARAAFQGVMSGITRVEALRQSVFSHEAALQAKEEGLHAGVTGGLAVLDARRELFSAKRDLAAARYNYVLSSLKLKQSAGILGPEDLKEINAYLQ